MIKFFCCKINSGIFCIFFAMTFLLGCSCTPTPSPDIKLEGIQPVWETKLPGKAGIYNYGLIGLPVFNGKILFHSTYFTSIDGEDNRIHSLDMVTGEIKWTYPSFYNSIKPMFFEGAPFQNNELLVTKMRKYGSVLTSKLTCIDLNTGEEVWYKEIPASLSYNTNTNIVGEGSEFYYFVQSKENAILCKGNIVSGHNNPVLQIPSEKGFNYTNITSNIEFYKEELVIAGGWERDTSNSDVYFSKNYLYIINIKDSAVVRKIYTDSLDNTMLISRVYRDGDKVFAACGLTTICYNLNTQTIDWTYKSSESYNYMTNQVVVNNDIVFLYGDNRYVGLDAQTGRKLYQGDIQCGNADAFNGYVYVIGRDAKLYILDIKTGKTLHRIICPEEYTTNTGFNTYCKPQVYGDKLYVFGNYHAYCYDAVPKEQ